MSENPDSIIPELQKLYERYLEFKDNGMFKLRYRTNTQNQTQYDFDFSNYSYYYNCPPNLVNFESPDVQKDFAAEVITFCEEDFTKYTQANPDAQYHNHFSDLVWERNNFKEVRHQLYSHFSKRLRMCQDREQFLNREYKHLLKSGEQQSKLLKKVVEGQLKRNHIELRSYLSKITRLSEEISPVRLGKQTLKRVLPALTEQGKSKYFPTEEQISSTGFDKTDFVSYARFKLRQMRVCMNIHKIKQQLTLLSSIKLNEIICRRHQLLKPQLQKRMAQENKLFEHIMAKLKDKLLKQKRDFLDDEQNMENLRAFCKGVTPVRTQSLKYYPNLEKSYEAPVWIPFLEFEFAQLARKACCMHITTNLIDATADLDLYVIKMNSYVSIEYRQWKESMRQIYSSNNSSENEDAALQRLIQGELEAIFEFEVTSKIIQPFKWKMRSYQMSIVDWDSFYYYRPKLSDKEQVLKDMLDNDNYFDPTIKDLISLLDSPEDKSCRSGDGPEERFRRSTRDYCDRTNTIRSNRLLAVKRTYQYKNVSQSQKIVEVVMRQLDRLKELDDEQKQDRFFNTRLNYEFNGGLLEVNYNLIFVGMLRLKRKLLGILNAQNCLQKNVVSDLQRSSRSKIPYEFTEAFNLKFSNMTDQEVLGYREKHQSDVPSPNMIDEADEIIQFSDDIRDGVSDVFVKGHNRMDAKRCLHSFIMYPKTLRDFKLLMQKIEKICSYYIERHENNLPECTLNEMTDRYVMLHTIMSAQVFYQYSKYRLMRQYYRIYKYTVDNQALSCLAQKIFDIKAPEYIFNPDNEYFSQSYRLATVILQKQEQLLQSLILIITKAESQDNRLFASKSNTHNLSNEIPQITIDHYSIESNLAKHSESSSVAIDRASIGSEINNIEQQRVIYAPRNHQSKTYDINQYLLKNNIVDILGENERQEVTLIGAKKREELIGFHSRPYMSDSMLGCPFWFTDDNKVLETLETKEYEHLWKILEVVAVIEQAPGDPAKKVALYEQAVNMLLLYRPSDERHQQLVRQDLLSNYLDQAYKELSNLEQNIEAFKFNGITTNFNLELLEAIKLRTSYNLINYRGVYLCINFVELLRLTGELARCRTLTAGYIEQIVRIITQFGAAAKDLIASFKKYTGTKLSADQDGLFNYEITSTHAYQALFYDNLKALRAATLYEYSLMLYFKQILLQLMDKVNAHCSAEREASLLLKSQLTCSKLHEVNVTIDLPDLQRKLNNLIKQFPNILNRKEILLMIQIKDTVVKQTQVHQKVTIANLDSLIQAKIHSNNRLMCLNQSSYNLFKLGKNFRYRNYFSDIKQNIIKLRKIVPLLSTYVILPNQVDFSLIRKPQQQEVSTSNRMIFPTIFTTQQNSLIEGTFPFESLLEVEQQSQSEYQSSRTKIKRLLRQLSNKPYATNLLEKEIKPLDIENTYCIWVQLIEFVNNWLVQMSICSSKEDYLELRTIIAFERCIMPPVLEKYSTLLSRQNIITLRREQEGNVLFEQIEKQYDRLQHVKRDYKEALKYLKDYMELCVKAQVYCTPENLNFMIIENRLKQKQLYVALNDQKSYSVEAQKAQSLIFWHDDAKRLFFSECITQKHDSEATLQDDIRAYDNLEKKGFVFDQYRQFARIFRESPIDLPSYIQLNYLKSKPSIRIANLLKKLKYIGDIPMDQRTQMSERLTELSLLASMYNMIRSSDNRQMEMIDLFYQNSRIKDLCVMVGINIEVPQHSNSNQEYRRFEALINTKTIKLNKLENAALQYSKTVDNSKYYQSMVNKIIRIIIDTKIHELDFYRERYRQSRNDLTKQLELLNFNIFDKDRQLQLQENKLRKQLINNVIVPKVKINSFLSSPLCINNYFLPHTAKLAYVMSFLNKLRNMVLQVELIDQEFGFLIKTKDLEQCVNYLCKSFIGFSEKEFTMRTKSLIQRVDILERELMNNRRELACERQKNQLLKERSGLLVNNLVISQTSSIMMEVLSMKARWTQIMSIVKSMEAKYSREAHNKFVGVVDVAQRQKQMATDQYIKFRDLLVQMMRRDIEWNKIILDRELKQSIQKVLVKHEIDPKGQKPQSEQIDKLEEEYASRRYTEAETYLQQLKKQKYFYLMKIESMNNKHNRQVSYYNEQMRQKDKIQNSYLLERRRYEQLMEKYKTTHNQLKKADATVLEITRKMEAQDHTIYRLSRAVDSFQMKLTSRDSDAMSRHINSRINSGCEHIAKDLQQMAVQTEQLLKEYKTVITPKEEKRLPVRLSMDPQKHKSVDFKQNTANEFGLWREKYDSIHEKYHNLKEQLASLQNTMKLCLDNNKFELLSRQIDKITKHDESTNSLQFGDFAVRIKQPNRAHIKHRRIKTLWSEQTKES